MKAFGNGFSVVPILFIRMENVVGYGENAGYLLIQCFLKASFRGALKVDIVL